MTNEMKQQIKENETTVNRWKAERLSKILNQSVVLPESAANAFYKILGEFTDGFKIKTLCEKIDAQMPKLWDFMPPPKNETEWTDYFNDLITDCAAEECMTIKEVWQIISYDPAEFEEMRGNGFSFVEAFGELCMKETTEQMEKTKMQKTDAKQTQKNKFPPGNKIGKQFPPGVSGNPSGRPKLTRLTDSLRQQLSEAAPNAPEQTIAEQIAKILIKLALSGDVQAIKEIGNRTEGLPKQSVDIDFQINDWRTLAQNYSLNEQDVISEARILIAESIDDSSDE